MKNELKIKDFKTEDFMGLFSPDGVQIKVGTREVAKRFDKRNNDLVSAIDSRIESIKSMNESQYEDFTMNFEATTYKSRGKEYKEYLLTKDGFIFIVMGLEGIEAEKLKIQYINLFNTMAELIVTRGLAKINYKGMSKAVKEHRERLGKNIEWYHYSREADMINKIVLGMTAKQFKEINGMEINEATRDMVAEWKLKYIDKLERLNTELLEMDMSFSEREAFLTKRYLKELDRRIG